MTKCCGWVISLAAVSTAAEGAVVVVHPPSQVGVWQSDTDYVYGGSAYSGRVADDFAIDTPAIVRHVTWWGDYGWAASPPTSETVRIRFYSPRAADGLPGDVVSENSVLNPTRALTGAIVHGIAFGTSLTAPEHVFSADLAVPVSLDAGKPYWLEIAQIGDPSSRFEWECSGAFASGLAYAYPSEADWQSGTPGDLAFELSTVPEPATFALIVLGVGCVTRRGREDRHNSLFRR